MAEFTFSAKLENLESMLDFIKEGVEKLDFDAKVINQIRIASEEALVNVISYAYPDGAGNIEISCNAEDDSKEGKRLTIQIVDWGIAFNPLALPEPDINSPIEERRIGGLGIYMMRNIMDEIHYKRDGDKNILILVKF